jgi:hypothetical protein
MRFLADENIPIASIGYLRGYLRNLGYDVKSVSESSCGISDSQVLVGQKNKKEFCLPLI